MAIPSLDERRRMLVETAFNSDAFTVAKGEKTQDMLDNEANRAASAALARQQAGLPAVPARVVAPPDPAPLPVLDKLAGVVKYFAKDDPALMMMSKIKFKAHFAGVLTQGQLILEPACDPTWDAATAADVTYQELRALGLHRGGERIGIDTLGQWVKSKTFGACMPNGELTDDFVCTSTLLELDPEITKGKLEWSEMDCTLTINRKPIEDFVTNSAIRIYIGSTYSVPSGGKRGIKRFVPSESFVQSAIESKARQNKFHESREWMERIKTSGWDGKDRSLEILKAIGGWHEPVGTTGEIARITQDNALALSQFTKTCIGTVARTYDPGCQMDTMLVLKSAQGTKKSSLFRALAPANRFSDAHIDFGNKDSMMLMQKNTWYECAELSGMVKKEVQIVKGFITTRSDDFRLPFGRVITSNPRHCVLVGTTNDDTPLRDATGSRRFWIITVDDQHKTDMMYIESIKFQWWAQCIHTYFGSVGCPACKAAVDGEVRCPDHRWWLSVAEDKIREQINEKFVEQEPYVEWLRDFIKNIATDKSAKQGLHTAYKSSDALKVHELLEAAGLPPEKCHDRGQQQRMAYALKKCGYVKRHLEAGNVWISPGMQNRPSLMVVTSTATDITNKKQDDAPGQLSAGETTKKGEGETG
jgi:hypothetical protein